MICPNCGTEIRAGASFCTHCGTRLSAGPTQPPMAQTDIEQTVFSEEVIPAEGYVTTEASSDPPTEPVIPEQACSGEPSQDAEQLRFDESPQYGEQPHPETQPLQENQPVYYGQPVYYEQPQYVEQPQGDGSPFPAENPDGKRKGKKRPKAKKVPQAETEEPNEKKHKRGWIWILAAVLVIAVGLTAGMLLASMGTPAYQAKVLCGTAAEAMEAGDISGAVAAYSNAVYLDPTRAEAFYGRGTAYLALLPARDAGEANAYLALAKEDFETAHALAPETYPSPLPQEYLDAEAEYGSFTKVEIQRIELSDADLDYGAETYFSYDLVSVSGCSAADAINRRIEAHDQSFLNAYLNGARGRIASSYAAGSTNTGSYVCRMEAGTPYQDDRFLSIPYVVLWQVEGEDYEIPVPLNFDLRTGDEVSLGTVLGMNTEDARMAVLSAAAETYGDSLSEENLARIQDLELNRLRFWFDEETVWVYVQDALATPTVIFQNRMYER